MSSMKQLKNPTSYQTYFSKSIFFRFVSGCGAIVYKTAKSPSTAAKLQNISGWPMFSFPEFMASQLTCILPAAWTDKKLIIQEELTGTHLVLSATLGLGWGFCLFPCLNFTWGQKSCDTVLNQKTKVEETFYLISALTRNISFLSPPKNFIQCM